MEYFPPKKKISGVQLILIKFQDKSMHLLLIMFKMLFNLLTKTLLLKLIIFWILIFNLQSLTTMFILQIKRFLSAQWVKKFTKELLLEGKFSMRYKCTQDFTLKKIHFVHNRWFGLRKVYQMEIFDDIF